MPFQVHLIHSKIKQLIAWFLVLVWCLDPKYLKEFKIYIFSIELKTLRISVIMSLIIAILSTILAKLAIKMIQVYHNIGLEVYLLKKGC